MSEKMVKCGLLECSERQMSQAIAGLSPRTKNNIIRERMGLPRGESDDDIVRIGGWEGTRRQADEITSRLTREEKNRIIENKYK